MNKIALSAAALTLSLYAGCAPRQKPPASAAEKPALKIGLIVSEQDAGQWARAEEIFTKKLIELGASPVKATASPSPAEQLEQAGTLLAQGVAALVIVPRNLQNAARIVEAARAKNTPVVACGKMIENCTLDFFVDYDYEKTGYIQAKVVLAMAPEGNYIVLGGPPDPEYDLLLAGQEQAIKEHHGLTGKNINVLANPALDKGGADEARSRIANMVRFFRSENKAVHAVIAPDDAAADGVAAALDELGLAGRVALAGQGAGFNACRRLVNGTQAVTVYMSDRDSAAAAAESAVRLARGESPETLASAMGMRVRYIDNGRRHVPSFLLTPGMITRDRLPRTVLRDGLYSAEEIYENVSP